MIKPILNFYFFLINKKKEPILTLSIKEKIKACIVLLFLDYFLIVFFVAIKHLLIEAQILTPLTYRSTLNDFQMFLLPILIAPIVEEIVFRLWLKYTSFNLSLSISVLSFYVANTILRNPIYTNPNLKHTLFAIFFAVCVFFITYFLSKKYNNKLTSFFGRHTRLLFFFSAIAFGYAHMMNFEIRPSIMYLSPIVFGSFITSGLILGYIRIRLGFIYNVAFHMAANSIPILLYTLFK